MLLLILFVGFTNLEKDWGHHVEIFLSVPFRDSRGEHTNLQPFQKMVMNSSTLLNDAHVRLQTGGKKQNPGM